jgi:hypothetical protein
MRALFGLSVIIVFAFAACGSPTNIPTSRNLGVINVKDTSNGGSGYKVFPTGVFWTASNVNLPNSTVVPDSCIDTVYFPPDTTTRHITTQIDAGSPIHVSTSTAAGDMTPDTIPGVIVIYKGPAAGLTHTPGTNMTFAIPGAPGGFEAVTMAAKTAALLSLGPIDPQPPDSLRLTWNLQTPGTTAVGFSLLYKTTGSLTFNRQVLCSLIDDGEAYVDKKTITKWKNAYPDQAVQAFRWVTTYQTGSNASLLLAISEFDTVKASLP